MNAVEIEEAISALAEQPFDAGEFPFAFLQAFGNKETTIKRLRKGESNKSDLGGVLQTNNVHIAVAAPGEVTKTLAALKASPASARAKAKFVLATDGDTFEAEDLVSGETVACAYANFPDHFSFFLPLAGITTVKQVRDSSFDIRATSRLNRLYVELLKDNPEWGTAERRPDMNHFMARLIFCFFAEDTDIFNGAGLFTATIEQMSARDSSNTHEVIGALFRAMNTKIADRAATKLPRWAEVFPYVNGGLFSGRMDVPRFSRIARSYLLHIGNLDWTKINPDIFGSMIQAVADDDERGALGMHYTSVPNILKVLNPLFLNDLRERLEEAGDNPRTLLNLRKRMSKIRVFDPACGSGNFLVIAYKEMRAIEAEINKRREEADRASEIPLTNFRGIELRDFPAEVARLALIIAEYQCDVLYRGQKLALAEFLPLDAQNWITCCYRRRESAQRWRRKQRRGAQPSTSVAEYGWVASPVKAGLRPPPPATDGLDTACHPAIVCHQAFDCKERLRCTQTQGPCQLFSLRHLCADSDNHPHLRQRASLGLAQHLSAHGNGRQIKHHAEDLFHTPLDQAQIDFENEGGETYVCGNPPYIGGKKQNSAQKKDMNSIFGKEEKHKNLDYICGFIVKACVFLENATKAALVTTNSVAQGTHVPVLWPVIYRLGCQVEFAYETFKWANNAQRNAGVPCTIIGLRKEDIGAKYIYSESARRQVSNINPYLVEGANIIVDSQSKNNNSLSAMITGNAAYDGGHLFL